MNKPLFVFQVFASLACVGFAIQNLVRGFIPFFVMMAAFAAFNGYNAYSTFKAGRR